MSRPAFLATLNYMAARIPADEIYLEAGVHQGGSLIGALLGNTTQAIAVDNFSQFAEAANAEKLRSNLQEFGVIDRVDFRETDLNEFFASYNETRKIGVFYYDAEHTYKATVSIIKKALPFMATYGILVVDDILIPPVEKAVMKLLKEEALSLQLFIKPETICHPDWWNGIAVMRLEQ